MLPLGLSVPHAGLSVPDRVASACVLTAQQILEDGDVGAGEIYDISGLVAALETTETPRAIVDLNRAANDRSRDGVVKTHTCWDEPVYKALLPREVVEALLREHYYPYHRRLSEFASTATVRMGIDCHTMAAKGPPVGPDPGASRPWICLSNGDGTCPEAWIQALGQVFEDLLDGPVKINDPFRGGYISRHHSREMPWLQLEMSREPFLSNAEKRAVVVEALTRWSNAVL